MLLFDFLPSGNGYKIRLLLSLLQQPYELREINILNGESRTTEFLSINPNGRIPVLQHEGVNLAESNAILWYLAQQTNYLPQERMQQAQVLQWLFFEQYSHEPFIATSRYWIHILKAKEQYREQLAQKRAGGLAALALMETQLTKTTCLVGETFSIADIALYAYTHVADEGEFDLTEYPYILAWMERIRALPHYVSLNSFLTDSKIKQR